MKHPRLKKRIFSRYETSKYFPLGRAPRSSDRFKQQSVVAVKRLLTLQPAGHPIQLPSRIQGAVHPASTFSIELAALAVCVGTTRPARRLQIVCFFAQPKNNEIYVPGTWYVFIRHRNETRGWHVCAGRVKYVVYLDLTVVRTGPRDDGAGRAADAPGGPDVGEHTPEGVTMKT